jgi:hypothetical protein
MNDINPIKNPIDLPIFTQSEIIAAILIGLFLLLTISLWLFYKYGRKYFGKTNSEIVEPVVEVDYTIELRERLDQVKKLLKIGDYKKFHLEISELLKFYFEKKYNCSALSMTSTELLRLDELSPWQKRKIAEFFEKNDMAKYAGIGLRQEIAEGLLQLSEELINSK